MAKNDSKTNNSTKGDSRSKQQEHPLSATRKRFIQLSGTALGATLSGCGYGFVATNMGAAKLRLPMDSAEQGALAFYMSMRASKAIQNRFVADPVGTMSAAGAVPPESASQVSRANKLLLYMLANEDLSKRVAEVALQRAARFPTPNAFTSANSNIQELHEAVGAVELAADDRSLVQEQVSIIVGDATFRDILGLQLSQSDVPAYVARLTEKLMARKIAGDGGVPTPNPDIGIINVNFFLNANIKFNANYNTNVNINANANANLNYNFNFNQNCNGNSCGNDQPMPGGRRIVDPRFVSFLDALVARSHELAQ